jgi:hypothetical protein
MMFKVNGHFPGRGFDPLQVYEDDYIHKQVHNTDNFFN